MFKCNSCGEQKVLGQMQRIAADHNVCISCKRRYQQKGLWDIKNNDIAWSKTPHTIE